MKMIAQRHAMPSSLDHSNPPRNAEQRERSGRPDPGCYSPVTERISARYRSSIRRLVSSREEVFMTHTALPAAVFALAILVPAAHADDPKNEPKTELSKRLPGDELREHLRKHLLDSNPNLNLGDDFAVKELTTDAVWERCKVQVVKVKGGTPALTNHTFVVRKADVFGIGQSFGGNGVGSLAVVDLKGDGRPLLVYAFAWGSGEHRSQIAAVNCAAKEPKELVAPLTNYSFKDYALKATEAKTIEVYAGETKIGRVALEMKDERPVLQIHLDEKVPDEIKTKLREAPRK
jgi:hypothetical protein